MTATAGARNMARAIAATASERHQIGGWAFSLAVVAGLAAFVLVVMGAIA